jgi:hypothetical protein
VAIRLWHRAITTKEAFMRVKVQLHAGWSVNHVVPILFPDRPIVPAVLSDEHSGNSPLVLIVDGITYSAADLVPDSLTSHYIRVMADVLLGSYDRAEPQNCELVARWYRESEFPVRPLHEHAAHA